VNRYIPKHVKLLLRQEVNWGCPVQGCGSPFLSYHHFDPPFAEFTDRQQHDPEGMIALCLAHAKMADGGVWTKDQLRQMKRFPFLRGGEVAGRLEWLRQDVILRFGGLTCVRPKVILEIAGKPLIWVNRDNGDNMLLNMDIPDSNGMPLLRMESNDWQVFGSISNLEAVPSGRSIQVEIPKAGFALTMEFRDMSESELRSAVEAKATESAKRRWSEYEELFKALPQLSRIRPSLEEEVELAKQEAWRPYNEYITSWPALEVTLTGCLSAPRPIILTPSSLQHHGLLIADSASFNCQTAISIA
jgi:hypothetical protein